MVNRKDIKNRFAKINMNGKENCIEVSKATVYVNCVREITVF
jgi:hypothetical protein